MQPDTELVVKISREDAGAISLTRVQQQRIRVRDLVSLIVTTTGKDAPRIAAILARGVFVKGMSRLRWDGFAGDIVVAECLEALPDAWPERPFLLGDVTGLEIHQGRVALRLSMKQAAARRWFRGRSFRHWLERNCTEETPRYQGYDYELRADVFAWDLDHSQSDSLRMAADLLADAGLRRGLMDAPARRITFHLPRT